MENPLALPYYQLKEFSAQLCGQNVRVISKPGLPNWDEVTPAIQLLAEQVHLGENSQALVMGCSNGALGVSLCRQVKASGLKMVDTNWAALRVSKTTMAANGFPSVPVEPLQYPLPAQAYNTILIHLPKGRKLARRWLVETWSALMPGGDLYLAGANAEGIQSVIKDAGSLFGNATVLAFRKGSRVARMVKQHAPGIATASPLDREAILADFQLPAWTAEPGIARDSWCEFTTSVWGESFTIRSLPGVFSIDRLDDGTELLLQQLTPKRVQGRRVLDFGCGYGLIGLVAARLGAEWADMLDVDLSAVASARENCARNQIQNAEARQSDLLDAVGPEHYDLILSNPPFHTGKQVEYGIAETFIAHSHFILQPGGNLVLVANRFIRYDRLMKDVYGNVNILAETGKYHVIESRR
jgi:16S rRNA (guanine1207-N2)-methyltransferase